jgi:hypothetical protein
MHDEHDTPLTEEELALARRGEALVSAAVADVHAPQSLREAVERDRTRAAKTARAPFWRRHSRRLTAATGAIAALAAVAIALDSGTENATEPSQAKVQATARLDPTGPAPASIGGTPPVVDVKVGAHDFPDWTKKFGWKATGRRQDDLSGRTVTTVFYRNSKGARLGYAIVDGAPLGDPAPGRRLTRDGNAYNVVRTDRQTTITWTEKGHTCVIVAPSTVPERKLMDLAASRNA